MLFRGAVNGEPVNGTEQDRPMKEKQQRQNRQNPKATTPFSVWPRILLLIIFHEHFILWSALERARDRKFEVCLARGGGTRRGESPDARKRVSPFSPKT